MRTQTQNAMIKEYLEAGNSITPMDALVRFGVFRLAARIFELKKAGVPIKRTTITDNGMIYARYEIGVTK